MVVPSHSTLRSAVQVPDHVVYRRFPLETVVLNVSTGQYHGLNTMASAILDRLQSEATVADAIERLAREYDVPPDRLRDDVLALCESLLDRGLLVTAPGNQ
jgi:hypothetical protein